MEDDDKGDLHEDIEALFGHSFQAPMVIDNGEDQDANPKLEVEEGDDNSVKRKHPSTSIVWEDYKKLFKVVNGKKVRYATKCIHCNKQYWSPGLA